MNPRVGGGGKTSSPCAIEAGLKKVGSSEDRRVSCLQAESLCQNCHKPPLTREWDRVSGGRFELPKTGGLEGKRVGCLQEQSARLCHSEPSYCEAEDENIKVSGEASPRIMSGILRAKNNCHPQNDVTANQTPTPNPSPLERGKVAFTFAEVFSPHSDGHQKAAFTLAEVFTPHFIGYRKTAFTLAEVLITLGIIGVVAAMTLPALNQKINSRKFQTGFKKTLSILNQAVNMNKAQYGFDFSSVTENCIDEKTDKADKVQSVCSIFNSSLSNPKVLNYQNLYINKDTLYYQELYNKGVTTDTLIKEQHIELYYYQMNDGSLVAFHAPTKTTSDDTSCTLKKRSIEDAMNDTQFQKYCVGFIDVNGVNRPNKEIRCNDKKAHYTDIDTECSVDEITDVYPVIFYDSVVAPASAAAKAVLYK